MYCTKWSTVFPTLLYFAKIRGNWFQEKYFGEMSLPWFADTNTCTYVRSMRGYHVITYLILQFSRKRSQFAKFAKYRGVEKNHLYDNLVTGQIDDSYYIIIGFYISVLACCCCLFQMCFKDIIVSWDIHVQLMNQYKSQN